jgi:hypothetical protein
MRMSTGPATKSIAKTIAPRSGTEANIKREHPISTPLFPTESGHHDVEELPRRPFVVNFGIETYSCTVNVAVAELP